MAQKKRKRGPKAPKPKQRPGAYILWARTTYQKKIARRLITAMQEPRLGFNDEFMSLMSDYARFMCRTRQVGGMPHGNKNWMSDFLKWALRGRVRTFIRFLRETPHPHRKKILWALDWIAKFRWPFFFPAGPIHQLIWGWFAKELYGEAWFLRRHRRGRFAGLFDAPYGLVTLPPDLQHRTRFTLDPDKPNYGFKFWWN